MRTPLTHRGGRTTGRRRTAPLLATVVALMALAAAGCGDGSPTNTATNTGPSDASGSVPPPSAAPTGAAPTAAPGTPATGPAAPAGPSASSAPPAPSAPRTAAVRCTVTDLRMRLGRGDQGAGQTYYPLRFTNTSARTCVLNGFPGVSLLRGDGSTIGRPAGREGPRGSAVRLAPGATVEADLHTLNQGVRGDGCWRAPTLLMAYPPGSEDAMTLATSKPVVCGGTFDVGAVH